LSLPKRLAGVKRLFLDTAPIIYFVQQDQRYLNILRIVFERVDKGLLLAVTSPVTLAECLVMPYRQGRLALAQCFTDLILYDKNTTFVPIIEETALKAADLRSRYNLVLADAFQVATSVLSGCDAFLTNDKDLKRVTEVNVILLDD